MADKKGSVLKIELLVEGELGKGGPSRFEQKSVIIGNGPTANLNIEHDSVSSIHAILKAGKEDNTALLNDLGSDQGTKLNGEEIDHEVVVRAGDTITVGDVDISVQVIGADEAATKQVKLKSLAGKGEDVVDEEQPEKADEFQEDAEAESAKEPTPVQRPPRKSPPRSPSRKAKPEPAGTQVVRRRQIPRKKEIGTFVSGLNFFNRDVRPEEKPRPDAKMLEVKVTWGSVALDSWVFPDDRPITVGNSPKADIRITTDRFGVEMFPLISPAGSDGCTISATSDMELLVKRDGKDVDIGQVSAKGAQRSYKIGLDDRCLIQMGQLGFVIQYVSPARGVASLYSQKNDFRLARWFATLLVLAVGMWVCIQLTPESRVEASEYLKNPARFAQLIMPSQKVEKKKTFEEIKKKKQEKVKVEDTGRWKRAKTKNRTKNTSNVPREVKEAQDRKIATSAGILGLLKGKGGGTGDNASSIFGGSGITSLDQSLASLQSAGMGDSAGFGGLGIRGGGLGGGGGGLGLGGLGTAGYGRGSGSGYGSVKIGRRGRHKVKVRRGRTRIIGGLSQEVVGRYIQRYWAQFKYCYERELTKDPNLYGKVTVTFTIAGNGRVSEASVIQTTMNNANVEECVLRVVRRIRFPTPKGGGEVIVTYPFMFTTAG